MVFDDQSFSYDYNYRTDFGSTSSLVERDSKNKDNNNNNNNNNGPMRDDDRLSFKMPYQRSFDATNWSQLAESTLPLKTSALIRSGGGHSAGAKNLNYGGLGGPDNNGLPPPTPPSGLGGPSDGSSGDLLFHASIERRSKQMSRKLIYVNLVSLLINLLLAIVAFYFSFVNNSSATSAFAADCVLDFISSAIVLWRYYGDLNDVYMHAREQIACIYLGALFEISAVGIIIKAISDIVSGIEIEVETPGYDLLYLASAAVVACSILIAFKWSLYKTIRDASILLDVINSLISTIFAFTLCLMTVLSNFDSSFWYFDPILSIALALFMAGFGLKVIHQNFNILRPRHPSSSNFFGSPLAKLPLIDDDHRHDSRSTSVLTGRGQYQTNLNTSAENINQANWQKSDHSTIVFV
uniref:Transmembrane protein 163 n=1 Tax=Aceria tosichella TaxID=561515 RepID=A0A6G1SEA4_9ACAR